MNCHFNEFKTQDSGKGELGVSKAQILILLHVLEQQAAVKGFPCYPGPVLMGPRVEEQSGSECEGVWWSQGP